RMVQNAVDAATLAGARQLAENGVGGQTVLEIQVLSEVEEYAEVNGLDRNVVEAWFIDVDGDRLETVDPWAGPVNVNAEGVEVEGDMPFDTYFAHLLGFETMQATTSAKAWVLRGPCNGDNLFPIIVNANTFTTTTGGPTVGDIYTLWDFEDDHSPGNWGWINWTEYDDGEYVNHCPDGCAQLPNTTVLSQNIVDTSRSGGWSVGDWVNGSPGVSMQPVLGELAPYITGNPWPTVVIPLYDNVNQRPGQNTYYEITGFAAVKLRCAFNAQNQYLEHSPGDCDPCNQGSSNLTCIRGEFVEFVQPSGQDGCMDTGVVIPSFRKPASP
ncbi:MAG: hypothetical protein PVJ34_18580, partial [Anaerolineae bacterium]